MTKFLAITTCNAEQWRAHGRNMATSFARHWPSSVPLLFYSEDDVFDVPVEYNVPLYEAAPWLEPWKAARTKAQRGLEIRVDGRLRVYDYHWDAVKFSHKVAAIGAAAEGSDCDVLIWIDADIITFDHVSLEWLDALLPPAADIGLLDRATKYPECGYMMFRLPAARAVISEIVGLYQSGRIFELAEWHDSFAIGVCVKDAVRRGDLVLHSFADPALPKKHPFINSPLLSQCLDHLKGNRKQLGRSPKHERIIKDDVRYWK